ncbi:MAG TPA: hypothetical protein VFB99_06930 [Vicinamibacterales bacterium]|nr:hypothetical protein [Vicinamibacterales bacterium]
MPFARVNPPGWGPNVLFQSAEANQLDINVSRSANVTDGDTWTPAAPIIVNSGVLRMAGTSDLEIETGADLLVKNGGDVIVENGGDITIQSSAAIVVDVGGTITLNGTETVQGTLTINATENIANGGELNVESGGVATVETGGILRFEGTTTPTYVTPSARTFTRTASPVAAYNFTNYASPVHQTPTGNYTYNVLSDGTDAWVLFAIDPPDGCTITECSIRIDPPVHANVPAIPPELHLYTQNVTDGSAVTDDSQIDTSVDGAAFSVAHTITITGLSRTIDKDTTACWLGFRGYGITNGVAVCRVYIPKFTFTRAKLGEE